MRAWISSGGRAILVAAAIACFAAVQGPGSTASAFRQPTGYPQLVSIEEGPGVAEMCQTLPLPPERVLPAYVAGSAAQNGEDRPFAPIRTIRDTYPIYSSVALDLARDEVILQDNNLWSTKIFNRLDDTPPNLEFQPPKRVIEGQRTRIQFNNGLYVDQQNGDIYSIESDTGDKIVIFSREANGNVPPKRHIVTPHRGYAVTVDETRQELYATIEYPSEVAVFAKDAEGEEPPIRSLQGDRTQLHAPHGLALDVHRNLMFVNTWGNESNFRVPGTGRFHPPSINVYALGASGNTPPLRVIQGDSTQLNWPGGMSLDPDTGDVYVANDVGHSILVFKGTDEGNVAPSRVIAGGRTGLRNPTGVFVDTRHNEVWVANLGNSSATVYPLNANGNVAPLRTIRSRPLGTRSLTMGKTEAVAYDSRRQEILVPN